MTIRRRSRPALYVRPLLLALCGIVAGPVAAEDWPQWRGPRRDAVSREAGLLGAWPEGGPPLAWQATGIGTGYASVVVSGDRVYTVGQQGTDVLVGSLQEQDGRPAWIRNIGETSRDTCSTPTVDGDRLYVLDPDGELVCLQSQTGAPLWQRHLVDDFGGRMMSGRGFGESPLVDGDRLICSPGGPDAALVALHKLTGEVIWQARVPKLGAAGRDGMGFSSIVIAEIAGVRQYVQLLGRGLVGVDARTGRWLWGYNAISNDTANIPTPLIQGDLVFSANGYNTGSVLLRIVPEPATDPHAANWRADVVYALKGSQFQNHHGGVVHVGDYVYGGHGSNNGLPTCLEFATGRLRWKRRGPGVGSASVVAADSRLYFRYQNGVVALIEPEDEGFTIRGTLQIPGAGGDSWSHPVVANGRLYLREQDCLWVFDVRRNLSVVPRLAPPASATTPLPGQLAILRELGAAVEPLTGEAPTLYRYAATASNAVDQSPAYVVRLFDRHLTPDGTLVPACQEALHGIASPIVLNLSGTNISATGCAQLAKVPNVVGLNLELCDAVSDAALRELLPLSGLRVLILAGTDVTAAGLSHLTPLQQLAALDLEVCDGIVDPACEYLQACTQLRALSLKKTGFEPDRVTDAGLECLSRLEQLESLNLYGNQITDAGLVHLQQLRSLRELDLSLLPITDVGIAHLKPLQHLTRLELLFSVGFAGPTLTDTATDSLGTLRNLRFLNLTGTKLTDSGLERLHVLHDLRELRLVRADVTQSGLHAFQAALPMCNVVASSSDALPRP